MKKLRVFTIIADVLLLIGIGLAIALQSAGNLLALAFLPWLGWPYLIAIQVWWSGKTKITQICLAIFIALCALIQGVVYFTVFIWRADPQSTFSWFLSPLYCLLVTVLLIPYVIERRKKQLSSTTSPPNSGNSAHG